MTKFRTTAPFGVSTKRFATIGFHPGLDTTGAMRNRGGLGPGQYNPKDLKCTCVYKSTKTDKETWTRKLLLEEFSQNLGYRNASVLVARQKIKTIRGPGYYDVDESIFKPCCPSVFENCLFGRVPRFKQMKPKVDNPPPGTYGNPLEKYERNLKPRHQFTKVPPFEWDARDRFQTRYRSWELPCNLYADAKVPGGVDDLIRKLVSKRGPYDLFTGPRDSTTIKGYFASPSFKGVDSWPTALPSFVDELLYSKIRLRRGKFFTSERFEELKDSGVPGPGHYYDGMPKEFKHNKHPFNSSVLHVRPCIRITLQPGPGRYENNGVKCSMKTDPNSKYTWQFKSKTKRTEYRAKEYNAF